MGSLRSASGGGAWGHLEELGPLGLKFRSRRTLKIRRTIHSDRFFMGRRNSFGAPSCSMPRKSWKPLGSRQVLAIYHDLHGDAAEDAENAAVKAEVRGEAEADGLQATSKGHPKLL